MPPDLSKRQASFTSATAALVVEAFRLWDPVANFFDQIIRLASPFLPVSQGIARGLLESVFLFIIGLTFFGILQTRLGTYLYRLWKSFEDQASYAIRFVLRVPPRKIYREGERASREFRGHVCRSIRYSRHMYFLLFAGYTMVYEDESFILEAIRELSLKQLQSADIRFLLLDPQSQHWLLRAKDFVEARRGSGRVNNVDEYKEMCRQARTTIEQIPGVQIVNYDGAPPLWRLHIFDDYVFVSRYSEHGDPEFKEGHRTWVAAFSPNNPMYRWLYSAFRSRCPDEWRKKLPYRLTPSAGE